jgi:hypothetical protein
VAESGVKRRYVRINQRRLRRFGSEDWETRLLIMLRSKIEDHIEEYNAELALWLAKRVIYMSRRHGQFQYYETCESFFEDPWFPQNRAEYRPHGWVAKDETR